MDPDISKLAQLFVMVGAFAAFVVVLGIVARAGFAWTRPRPRPLPAPGAPTIDDARFARLEDAVDSIAIEVERVAEAQRFTAKLMSERIPERLAERAPGSGSNRPATQ